MVFDPINKAMAQKVDEDGNNVWEFDSSGANKALELLGRHLAMFTDKTKQSVEIKTDLKPFFTIPIKPNGI
jgi:phage terminase small subunit